MQVLKEAQLRAKTVDEKKAIEEVLRRNDLVDECTPPTFNERV